MTKQGFNTFFQCNRIKMKACEGFNFTGFMLIHENRNFSVFHYNLPRCRYAFSILYKQVINTVRQVGQIKLYVASFG